MSQVGNNSKLVTLAPENFRTYRHTDDSGHVETASANCMPLPTWPDGRWCFEICLYLNSTKFKLSLSSRGGSYSAIAYSLSHLTRYCHLNRIGFLELTDSKFTMFINGLSVKTERADGSRVAPRSENRVLRIGREALSFLYYIGVFYGRPNFVGQEGTIRGAIKTYMVPSKRRGGKDLVKHYWDHESFPPPGPINRRHPIGDEYVSRLRRAVIGLSRSPFLRQRRLMLIRLLDETGARRIELANLCMASVAEARAMATRGDPAFLRLLTFKKRGGPKERFIPIDEVTLSAIEDYLEFYRAPLVDKVRFDCGFVLLSDEGTQLKPNTLTQEIRNLRKAAGIEGKAHPHLFRHRYLSRRLTQLISENDFKDTAAVIGYLLKAGSAMQKLLEESGHASVKSLEPYIDDAFMAKNGRQGAVEGEDLSRLSYAVQASVDELTLLQSTLTAEELLGMTLSSYKAFAAALKRQT